MYSNFEDDINADDFCTKKCTDTDNIDNTNKDIIDLNNILNELEEANVEEIINKSFEDNELTIDTAIEDLQNGYEDAFYFIYDKYKNKLLGLSSRMNDEDLVQELSIVLYTAAKKYKKDMGTKFNTFFWSCARNHIGVQKTKKNAKKRQADIDAVSLYQPCSYKDSEVELGEFLKDDKFDGLLNNKELMIDLLKVLDELNPKEKYAIMQIIDAATLQEIADNFNVSASAIYVMLRRLSKKKSIAKKIYKILKAE